MTMQEQTRLCIVHQELLGKISVSLEFIKESLESQTEELQALRGVASKHTAELQGINGRLATINGTIGRHDTDIRRHSDELKEVAVHASESRTYAKVGFKNHNALVGVVEALTSDVRGIQEEVSVAHGVVKGGMKVGYAGWLILSAFGAGFVALMTMLVRLQGTLETLSHTPVGK